MKTSLKISNARLALSSKGQFLIFNASNTEKSHHGFFYNIQLVIGISNEHERIQFNYSDYNFDASENLKKWTQFFYLAPYFFSVLASGISKAEITIDDREHNINELVNSLKINFQLS